MPMGVRTPVSAHAGPSAWPSINVSVNFPPFDISPPKIGAWSPCKSLEPYDNPFLEKSKDRRKKERKKASGGHIVN